MPSTILVQRAPHDWSRVETRTVIHRCYLCSPKEYPPMPDFHTVCACCGDLIKVDALDPLNFRMAVCPECDSHIRSAD